jgi:hypothetical protein
MEVPMRKLLLIAAGLLPACGSGGGNNPTPVTQAPAPPAATPAPAPTPVPVPTVSGSWDSEARRWHFRLVHTGSTVTGQLLGFANTYYPDPNNSDLAIRGTVSSTGAISFGCRSDGVSFEGRIENSSRMTGTLVDCVNGCRTFGDILVKTAN